MLKTRVRTLVAGTSVLRSFWRLLCRPGRYFVFIQDFVRFSRLLSQTGHIGLRWRERYPCLSDRTTDTGFDRHYVYHTAWAARHLVTDLPREHIDIGSSLYFVSLVSSFLTVRFYDYRPAALQLSGLTCGQADLLALFFPDNSVMSLSCMHVIEHVGLGRYGDHLDVAGDVRAAAELARVLAPGGSLLVVVPVGRPRIAFNAHRVYSFEQVMQLFSCLRLTHFSLIPDDPATGLLDGADPELVDQQEYGCGCYRFEK